MPHYYLAPESSSSGSGVRFYSNSSETLPDKYKWSIYIVTGGGCWIQNKESGLYLTALDSSDSLSSIRTYSKYTSRSSGYYRQIWRIIAADQYVEMSPDVSFDALTLEVGKTATPSVKKSTPASWVAYTDFNYSIPDDSGHVWYNQGTQKFTGLSVGTVSVTATHKITGISVDLTIYVKGLLIYQTRDRERLGFADSSDLTDVTPITAEDLTYGQVYTDAIMSNGTGISWSDLYDGQTPLPLAQRVTIVKDLFNGLVSGDATFTAILSDMFDHFVEGSGSDYSNVALTNAVKNHANTIDYQEKVIAIVKNEVSNVEGNISALYYDEQLWLNPVERQNQVIVKDMLAEKVWLPSYGYDTGVAGLTLAIDGWYGNKIEIESFSANEDQYLGTLRFTFYDHFGLDTSDLSEAKYGVVKAGALAGFRQWYILQHWSELGYSEQPKPFVTIVSYTVEFRGEYA
jgi:hypothetical protein